MCQRKVLCSMSSVKENRASVGVVRRLCGRGRWNQLFLSSSLPISRCVRWLSHAIMIVCLCPQHVRMRGRRKTFPLLLFLMTHVCFCKISVETWSNLKSQGNYGSFKKRHVILKEAQHDTITPPMTDKPVWPVVLAAVNWLLVQGLF